MMGKLKAWATLFFAVLLCIFADIRDPFVDGIMDDLQDEIEHGYERGK